MTVRRYTGRRGRRHVGRVQGVRHPVANVGRLSAGRRAGRAQLRAVRVHAGRDHAGTELRDHARHAPEQAAVAEARVVHNAVRVDVRGRDGRAAAVRRVRLPEVRHVPAVRDDHQRVEPDVRGVSDVHQRRRVLHTDGLLPEDVLRDPGLAGVELERLAHRQAHGPARVHRPAVLGTDRVRIADRDRRLPSGVPRTSQGVHRVRVTAELVLQPVLIRHTHQTVQEGLRDDMQGDRGVPRHPRHRPVPAQFELQQSADARQHQQPGGPVVPGQLSAPTVQLQREAVGRRHEVDEGGRDVLRLAERQVPRRDVVPATRVRVRAPVHAQRPVRVPDSRDPAEATQTRVVHVVQRELQFVPVGLLAEPPSSPSPSSSLRRTVAVARPQTAAGQLVDRHPENVAGLEPVQFPERQFRFREHGKHECQHAGVQVKRERRLWRRPPQTAKAAADAPVGGAGRRRTAAAGHRFGLFAEQVDRPVFGHHTVGGRDERPPGRHRRRG